MFEKLKLPVFDGMRRSYPTFKLEWQETAGCSGYSPELEVRDLRKKLPILTRSRGSLHAGYCFPVTRL